MQQIVASRISAGIARNWCSIAENQAIRAAAAEAARDPGEQQMQELGTMEGIWTWRNS
jgi:hypothetical protein